MSEWTSVLAVYWALWAVDGLKTARARSFVLIGGGWRRTRQHYAQWIPPTFGPLRWRMTTADVPLTLSPAGISNVPAGCAGRPAEFPRKPCAWRWEDIRKVGIAAGALYINDQRFCPATGHMDGPAILRLAAMRVEDRPPAIQALISGWFRPAELRRRAQVLTRRTRLPAILNAVALTLMAALSIYVIADVPTRLTENQAAVVARAVPFVAGGLLVVHVTAVIAAWRTVRRLKVQGTDNRRTALLSALLLPPQALKLRALTGEGYFPAQHPLAAVLAFGDDGMRRDLAFNALADLRWPLPRPEDPPLVQSIGSWFRNALASQIEFRLRKAGLQTRILLSPPPPDSPASCAYCPRCRDQFVAGGGCPHGLTLQPLDRIPTRD